MIAAIAAALTALLHAAFAGRYDLSRDELYFIVCGQHPAFGYADQPPLVPLLAAGLHALGGGVWLVRLPVVLAAGALVWVTARLTALLGGSRLAVALAALAAAIAPMLMGLTGRGSGAAACRPGCGDRSADQVRPDILGSEPGAGAVPDA